MFDLGSLDNIFDQSDLEKESSTAKMSKSAQKNDKPSAKIWFCNARDLHSSEQHQSANWGPWSGWSWYEAKHGPKTVQNCFRHWAGWASGQATIESN